MKYCIILVSAMLLCFSACKHPRNTNLPESKSTLGTLIVVSDKATIDATSGAVDACFHQPVPYLDNNEAYFTLQKPEPETFMKFFSDAKSIVVLVTSENKNDLEDILESFTSDSVTALIKDKESGPVYRSDVYARHQHVAFLFGNDAASISEKLNTHKTSLLNTLINFELADQKAQILSDSSATGKDLYAKFRQQYGAGVQIPPSFKLMHENNGFYWFQQESKEGQQEKLIGLIVHGYTYTSDSLTFNMDHIIAMRDSFTKINIPFSEVPGTYMSTSSSSRFPKRIAELIAVNDLPALRVRGWWSVKGATDMYGPFVRYVVHNPMYQSVLVFEGFVYKPGGTSKISDLRMVESIAQTIH